MAAARCPRTAEAQGLHAGVQLEMHDASLAVLPGSMLRSCRKFEAVALLACRSSLRSCRPVPFMEAMRGLWAALWSSCKPWQHQQPLLMGFYLPVQHQRQREQH